MNTRRTPDLDDLAPEPRAWLIAFKEANGAGWKRVLLDHWWNGTDEKLEGSHFARQIRNRQGPQWLEKLKD